MGLPEQKITAIYLNSPSEDVPNKTSVTEEVAGELSKLFLTISKNVSVGLREISPSSATYSNLKQIESSAKEGAEFLTQLLSTAGKAELCFEEINLNDLFDEVADSFDGKLPQNVELRMNQIVGVPSIKGDIKYLTRTIVGIIQNSIDAIGGLSGSITIHAGVMNYVANQRSNDELHTGHYVFIKIYDTGHGVSEKIKAFIFEPFFTTKLASRGMGLAVAKGIMSQHNGRILFKSSLGSGATVTLLFPALS
jgi:signal transduction histidine kinase